MKFANVYRAISSGRFTLRLAFFSFLCLVVFAVSSARLRVASATSAAAPVSTTQQKRVGGGGKSGAVNDKTDSRAGERSAAKAAAVKAAAARAEGDVARATVCAQNQAINFGQTVNGTLTDSDCIEPIRPEQERTRADEYTFFGTAGQQIAISMSATYDTYLFLLRPDGTVLTENDDIDSETTPGNQNSRITPIGFYILPFSGTYSILAASFAPESRGAYTLTLTSGVMCPRTPIAYGETKTGTLNAGDCTNPYEPDESLVELYTFDGTAGQQISVTMTGASPGNVDPFLYFLLPNGEVTADNDNGGGGTVARLPFGSGFGRLPVSGTYTIVANTRQVSQNGNYSLTLTRGPDCASASIALGSTVNGTLADGDCRLLEDSSFIDAYTFNGTAGQQIIVSMTSNTGGLVPTLFLYSPNGATVEIETAPDGSNTARIPGGSGTFTLPSSGAYTILANSFASGQTGNYTLRLINPAGCTSTLAATGREVPHTSGEFTVGVTTQTGCTVTAVSNSNFITVNSTNVNADGAGTVTYTVAANTTGANRTGTIAINGQTFTVTQAALVCSYTLAATGRVVSGDSGQFTVGVTTQPGCTITAVSNSNFITVNSTNVDANGAGTVTYSVTANTTSANRSGTITINGQTFTVTQSMQEVNCTYAVSPGVRPFRDEGGDGRLTVVTPAPCPWTATSNSSWITITSGFTSGTGTGRVRYTVAANTTGSTRAGAISVNGVSHIITQTSAGTTPMIQFSAPTFTVNENDGSKAATITVTRLGDRNGAATVEYATVDNPEAVPCDPNVKKPDGTSYPQGTAYARCDYATTVDTLTFGIGEDVKFFTIPLINDVHVEGNETFRISLSNPQGATLGGQSTADVVIQFEDTAPPTGNPINQTQFFVRMQYLDFLSREPEPSEPWSDVLNRCPNAFNAAANFSDRSAGCDRIIVSQSFFGSPEFRLKGLPVFLYYKASFGSANNPNYYPEYDQFAPDLRRVSGATAAEVFAKRLDFGEDWVTRTAFVNAFEGTSNEAFVDRLLSNLNITLTTADSVSGETRNSLVNSLNSGTKSRADVLRIIVESAEAATAQFNRAFVAMQYFGYLRRTPDPSGYQAWLNVLSNPTIDPQARPRLMIDGFMNSTEYRFRFGPNTTQP